MVFCDSFSVQAVGISEFKQKGTSTYEKWQNQVIDFHKDSNLEWGAVWMLIYPNIMVEWYPQTIVVSSLYPLEAQKTLNITEFYYAEEIALFNEEYVQFQKEAYKETAKEDDEIAERMEQGKQSMRIENKLNPNFLHPTLEKGIPEFYRYLKENSSTSLRKNTLNPLFETSAEVTPDILFVDCRHSLKDKDLGQRLYEDHHLPNAIFVHVENDMSDPEKISKKIYGRHPLPAVEDFINFLQVNGINSDTHLVAYDDDGGVYAARFWWMLNWIGHHKVSILNGGLKAWKRSGNHLENTKPIRKRGQIQKNQDLFINGK